MKIDYLKTKFPVYFLSLFMATILVSCGTSQNVANSGDGIYGDAPQPKKRVVTQNKTETPKENHFTKELERLESLNGTDIVTDIDNYKSDNYSEEIEETPRTQINNEYAGWGTSNDRRDNVTITVNTFPRYGFYDDLYWDPYHGYAYGRPWRYRAWNYNPYWNTGMYWNYGYYRPYRHGYYGNPYYYGYRRYRRPVYNSNPYRTGRIASRRSQASRRSSNVYRRSTNTRTSNNRRSTTVRRSTSPRRSTTIRKSTTPRRSSTARRSTSRSSNRSYNNTSRRSSNRSYNTSRSSSSRRSSGTSRRSRR